MARRFRVSMGENRNLLPQEVQRAVNQLAEIESYALAAIRF